MSYLILIRHGQSTWNLENRFTGWVDVDLTENGKLEAKKAGELIKTSNIQIDYYYSSLQLRANHTLKIIQKSLNDKKDFKRSWKLNERHYGGLTGLNKVGCSNTLTSSTFTRGNTQCVQFREIRLGLYGKGSLFGQVSFEFV